jgi:tetratricopeptide (TPR) repeat protein
MPEGHPSRDHLERFLRAELPAPAAGDVLRHLLAGCPSCQEITAALWNLNDDTDEEVLLAGIDPALNAAYDRVIDTAFHTLEQRQELQERDRAIAAQLWDELEHHPASRQQMLVRNSARFANAALCEVLLAKSHAACFQDPQHAATLAQLATVVAERVGEGREASDIGGLAARAWGTLGNARRVCGDHAAAERALATAEELLEDDPLPDSLDRARVLDWKASLRRDQGRFTESIQLLDRVIWIHRRTGQSHLQGRALAQKGLAFQVAGDLESAIDQLRRALEHLDPSEEPRQLLVAQHNLVYCLNETGRHREAFSLLFKTRPLYLEHGGRLGLIRLRYLEGKVAAGLGRKAQAAAAFQEVHEAFAQLELDYDAALVALDLAALYAAEGRSADVRRLAEQMLPIFSSRQIHREALAALIVFQRAAAMEEAGLELLRKVAEFLTRARTNPELRFG